MRAVAVNPVDYKVASGTVAEAGGIKVVGYDAAGVVVEAGRETTPSCANLQARACGQYSSAGEVRWRSLVSGCQP